MAKLKTPSRNVASFRAQHDPDVVVPNAIRAALEKMAATHGPEHYEYESDFISLTGIGNTALAAHRESFKDFIVEAKPVGKGNTRMARRAWFATKKGSNRSPRRVVCRFSGARRLVVQGSGVPVVARKRRFESCRAPASSFSIQEPRT
jgi:hypothetical protein